MFKLVQPSFFPSTTIMKSISTTQRFTVISLLQEGYSCRKIEAKTGLGRSTVSRVRKEVEIDKENHIGGCPSKLSPCDKSAIIRQITTGHLDNAVQVTQFINNTLPYPVTSQTVCNVLKEDSFYASTKQKVPLLKARHHTACLKFAREHMEWTVEDWKKVLWSDETKINRIGSDGRQVVWKKKKEQISDRTTTPTVKHGGGGNLMVWGCFGWNGVGKLVEVQGIMDKHQYCEILEDGVVESFEVLDLEEGERYFQQDNDPKHASHLATQWFEDHDIQVLVWPSQSPDLNPIEHLWEHLKHCLKKYPSPPKGVHELWDRVAEEWNKIPPEVCQTLIESMPRRMEAVMKAKGGHTKY